MKSTRLQKYLAESKKEKMVSKAKAEKAVVSVKKTPAKKSKDKDVILMDMPEVKDIPGQEHVHPPRMREMMDITVSSADEEGEGLLDDLNKEDEGDELSDADENVSDTERELLSQSDRPVNDEVIDRRKLSLDKTDGNDLLNEEGDPQDLGSDLDIPGAELDDADEEMGEEDEENNSYSRPD